MIMMIMMIPRMVTTTPFPVNPLSHAGWTFMSVPSLHRLIMINKVMVAMVIMINKVMIAMVIMI